ncbi:MAG: ATP-binding protein, partial [Chloroflexales bacterium]
VRHLSAALPTEWAVVQVSDDGIGIPRDQQQHIFERFYQVASSLTREQGGVGLGLSIVCDLTTLQGGVVWVESEAGKGSTFSFALPSAAM